jgi:cellulose synthase/poly-beta-1,6-N-acetylglucosamine synthase-like glycosyltransferase
MDADTIFARNTIRLLVRQFADLRVGAVAGNVKVGNRINLQTIWQSLEYITSQNFDRQAFSALNAVAVVPGAVGAWRRSAVLEAGGFETNTLAEDTDLTFKIRLLGYYTRCDNEALAFTEAPDSVGALAKQRFRWAFGILQALWKHRRKLFQPRYGAFSLVVMPSMWVFNIILQAIAPLVDLMVILSIFNGQLPDVLLYTVVFFVMDCVASVIAFRLDRENPTQIIWLFWQRFFYRQFMYYIIVKALTTALRGSVVGWGKLQRKATVELPLEKV